MKCSQCGQNLEGDGKAGRVASISGSIMGDECTDSYFFCEPCGVYTVEAYCDRFLGEDEISIRGPVSKSEGDAHVALIRECPRPWDKKCRCKAHISYFRGCLD